MLRTRVLGTAITIGTLLVILLSPSPVLSGRFDEFKQLQRVDLQPAKIGAEGNGKFTLAEALARIGESTGNPLKPELVTDPPEKSVELALEGETFWSAMEIVAREYGCDFVRLRRAWNRGTEFQPLAGQTIQTRIIDCLRVTIVVTERAPARGDKPSFRTLWVQIEAEPRLPYFAGGKGRYDAVDTRGGTIRDPATAMNYRRGNVLRIPYSLMEHPPARFRLELTLDYFFAWDWKEFGPLSKLKKNKDERLGKFRFKLQEVEDTPLGDARQVRVDLFERTALLDTSDFALRVKGGDTLTPEYQEAHTAATFQGVPKSASLKDLYLRLRVPAKTKSTKIRLTYSKE